jgi:hypothetical protein
VATLMWRGVFLQFFARRVRGHALERPLAQANHDVGSFHARVWGKAAAAAMSAPGPGNPARVEEGHCRRRATR